MKRLILVAAALSGLAATPAHAATNSYSTGNIKVAIPAGGTAQRQLIVRDRGPV